MFICNTFGCSYIEKGLSKGRTIRKVMGGGGGVGEKTEKKSMQTKNV